MRIVITGGAGFLGSHLCEKFLNGGHEVICLDNLITGKRENVHHLEGSPHFRFRLQDVTRHIDIEGPIEAILHFASPASPKDYLQMPIQTLKVGALGTHNALGLAKAKQARFLLASTSEVYGDPLVSPQAEVYWGNVNPLGPRGVYDEAKRFAEAMTLAYHRYHGIDTRIARIFNSYGPRMRPDDGRVISNFIVQALQGKKLTVYGDGKQTRSFCYISDLVEGIARLLFCEHKDQEICDGELLDGLHSPVNLGNSAVFTVNEVARIILRLTQSSSEIGYEPLPVDDPKVRCPNISRAQRLLNWTPQVGLEAGLRSTIDHFRGNLK